MLLNVILPRHVLPLLWLTLLAIGSVNAQSIVPLRDEIEDDYPTGTPIPTAPTAPTGAKFGKIFEAWANRIFVEAYERSAAPEPRVASFIARASHYLSAGRESEQKELSTEAQELEAAGVSDPVFELLAGVVTKDDAARTRLLSHATSAFPKTTYSPFLLSIAAMNLAKSFSDSKAPEAEIAKADQVALEALRRGLNQESFEPNQMSALRWRIYSPSFTSLFKRQSRAVAEIFEHATGLPDWMREFGQGYAYLKLAWQERTDGWSREVTAEGWKGWHSNLVLARAHLTKAWELHPEDPAAAAEMIEVTMGDTGEKAEIRGWFDRAVAGQMDYFDAYRAFIWALRPRWHGSHEEMLRFGQECLDTQRFDTCVPNYYFKVVADVASEEDDPVAFYDRPDIVTNLRTTLERYLSTPNTPISVSFAHTMLAVLDYRSGDLPAARTHMAAIGFQPDKAVGPALAKEFPAMLQALR